VTVEPHEIAAAQAVKFAQMLVADAERDSMPDKFKALKIRLATLSAIADSILASGPWEIINHWPPE
jgi:hypothetical protein